MGQPAARIGDNHTCPVVVPPPHVGGPIFTGSPDVTIGYMAAARVSDSLVCAGATDVIVAGALNVLINNLCAARMGDPTAHGGVIVQGLFSVLIGETNNPMQAIAEGINPTGSTINCGNNVDAAIARLYGTDPNATSPSTRDGTFPQIAARNGTNMNWGNNLNDAFNTVRNGGPGTTAIVGIDYGNGSSHVVVMTNYNGTPTIIEGQNWGPGQPAGAITDPAVAQARYNPANVGIAVLPNKAP